MIRAAAARIQSLDALNAEVTKVQHILDGSTEGRIKVGTERAALVAALAALCPAPADLPRAEELAEQCTEFLVQLHRWVSASAALAGFVDFPVESIGATVLFQWAVLVLLTSAVSSHQCCIPHLGSQTVCMVASFPY